MLTLNNPLRGYLARFHLGENLRDTMDSRSFRRVRSALIAAGGPDIAERFPDTGLELPPPPTRPSHPVMTLKLNEAQRAWLDSKRKHGESRGAALRRLAGIPQLGMREAPVLRLVKEARP